MDASCHVIFRLEELSLAFINRRKTGLTRRLSPRVHQLTAYFKMADDSMKKVKDSMAKKDAIEKEIKEFQDLLESVSPNHK